MFAIAILLLLGYSLTCWGFFSSLLKVGKTILKVGAGVLLGETAVSATESLLGTPDPLVAPTLSPVTQALAQAGQAAQVVSTSAQIMTGGGRQFARGRVPAEVARKVTRVMSLDASGTIIATQNFEGTPFLMNKDVIAAKRVFRLSQKLARKLPKRTVKQSAVSQLKDAAVDQAMRVIACPPTQIKGPC